MSKIRIRNFGPIKEGYHENDGWLDVKKVTVFIGNQGSGKSTVAKLISMFMWLEKALIRGDINEQISNKELLELISFHRIDNYLETNTEIEYEGATYRIELRKDNNSNKQFIAATKLNSKSVKLPKIMYVPAERNFLSSIENINKISNLIIGSLQSYLVEFRNAQLTSKGKAVELPINNTKVIYEANEDENYLLFGDNKRLKLSQASSGFHSIVPLYWVTKYLTDFIKQDEKILLKTLSTDQNIRRNYEIKDLISSELNEKEIKAREKKINEKYISKYFVNIVEEPEQNLFPTSQRLLLNSLLAFNNGNNMLVMTTHSPYLINYLTLCVKAESIYKILREKKYELSDPVYSQTNEIVPDSSAVNANDLAIYELDEPTGSIKRLPDYKGLPSDENKLNYNLEDSNELFAKLLEIQQGI